MQRIFSANYKVIETWLEFSQEYGANRHRSLFFEDNIIYSYGHHYPIAVFLERFGRKFFLLNSRSYSRTTLGHKHEVRHALGYPSKYPVFYMPIYQSYRDRYEKFIADSIEERFNNYLDDLKNTRKIYYPSMALIDADLDELNTITKYLTNNEPYTLEHFFDLNELLDLLDQADKRKELRKKRKEFREKLGVSYNTARKIVK